MIDERSLGPLVAPCHRKDGEVNVAKLSSPTSRMNSTTSFRFSRITPRATSPASILRRTVNQGKGLNLEKQGRARHSDQ